MHTNMNFPAWLAMAGIGAALVGCILTAAVVPTALIMRKTKIARITLKLFVRCALAYTLLLLGFSFGSRDEMLAHGTEKYFCEIDCHLAYSVVAVKQQRDAEGTHYLVTVRTRFDETTVSAHRPKDALLQPAPRTIYLMDAQNHRYTPESVSSVALDTPLIPGHSHLTELSFLAPSGVRDLRLLIATSGGWLDTMLIGDESSWLHKKTYFAI